MTANKIEKIFNVLFSTAGRRVSWYIKLLCFLKKHRLYLLALMVSRRLQRRYGVFITYNTVFDETLVLKHPTGIVIGDGVEIGRNVTIFQNVTLGRSDTGVEAYPRIGCNTIIYSGAVIIGDVSVGENCIIGANSVVTKSVPDNCVAVGAPARVISRG